VTVSVSAKPHIQVVDGDLEDPSDLDYIPPSHRLTTLCRHGQTAFEADTRTKSRYKSFFGYQGTVDRGDHR